MPCGSPGPRHSTGAPIARVLSRAVDGRPWLAGRISPRVRCRFCATPQRSSPAAPGDAEPDRGRLGDTCNTSLLACSMRLAIAQPCFGSSCQGCEDEQVEGSLQQIGGLAHVWYTPKLFTIRPRRTVVKTSRKRNRRACAHLWQARRRNGPQVRFFIGRARRETMCDTCWK